MLPLPEDHHLTQSPHAKYLQANTEAPQLPASVRRVQEGLRLRVRPKSPTSDTALSQKHLGCT